MEIRKLCNKRKEKSKSRDMPTHLTTCFAESCVVSHAKNKCEVEKKKSATQVDQYLVWLSFS